MTNTTDLTAAASRRSYEERKAEVARIIEGVAPGRSPDITYSDEEHEVWRLVSQALAPLHEEKACDEFNEGTAALAISPLEVPRLADVSDRLEAITGFSLAPAPGILPPAEFYSVLGFRSFRAALFVRSPASPFFAEDPDVLHELLGHANSLAHPRIARIYEAAGQTFNRLTDPVAISSFSRIFWFVFETGVIRSATGPRAFGAAILSSVAELAGLDDAEVARYTTAAEMVAQPYSISSVQPVVFGFDSFDHLEDAMGELFAPGTADDEFIRLAPAAVG